ncbi:MAG: MFS transporter [Bryobacterales bacterium]|nr:MFS transporter [Bryobacterales bacterium]
MNRPGLVLFLLVLSIGINYIDRGALSVSAPLLSKDLDLQPDQMGILFSAFFWSYAVLQLVGGWLVDRYDVKWVYALSYGLWSMATAATGFVTRLDALIGARLALGAGESVAYPAVSRILVRNFEKDRLGLANALVDVGAKIGPAISTLVGGLVVTQIGWRNMFLIVGLGSMLWLIPWMIFAPKEKKVHDAPSTANVSFGELLANRQLWATSFGMFCLGYVWYFMLTWLPSYLVRERGFSMKEMAVLGSAPFFVMAIATVSGGWLSDRWIRNGASPTKVRRGFCVVGLLGCGLLLLPAAFVNSAQHSVILISAALFSMGVYTSNVWAITQTLSGPEAAGRWSGVQNAVGNLGGVVSPALTGFIVGRLGSFWWAFVAATVVVLAGAFCYLALLGELRPVTWRKTKT